MNSNYETEIIYNSHLQSLSSIEKRANYLESDWKLHSTSIQLISKIILTMFNVALNDCVNIRLLDLQN